MQKQAPYSEAKAAQYPKGVFIVIAKDADGKCNPATVGSAMYASADPPMFAIALAPRHHTTAAIRHSGEFTLALPAEHQAEETMLYGTKSGRDTDKFELAGANTEPAAEIDCVLLSDAAGNYECKLAGECTVGDHVVFSGEIVCSHIHEPPLRRLYLVGPGYEMGAVSRD